MASVLLGTVAAPTPTGSVEVAGPSSPSCEPKSHYMCHIWPSSWTRKPQTFENSAYPQALNLEAQETLLWASQDLIWYEELKNVKALGFGNQ